VRFGLALPSMAARFESLHPGVDCFEIDERLADGLLATESSQGIAAVIEIPEQPLLQDVDLSDAPLLVLDGVADPGNVGTILRSAEWFAAAGVVLLPGCADPFNPKSVRASMGSLARVPIVEATHDEIIALERPLYALDTGARIALGRQPLPARAAYVVGSEAHGISDDIAHHATPIAIAGIGRVESLNAAIAASILLYELSRSDE
jgi:TrmH family RNA methyltransferase